MGECFLNGPTIACHGLRIGFRANRPSVLVALGSILPPCCNLIQSDELDFIYSFTLGEGGKPSKAYLGSKELGRSNSIDSVLRDAASHLEQTVAEHARDSVFIHSGVIGWRGRAILFPGRSCTGKSTLVRAMLRLGAVYFSDEFAVIDSAGLVHPFARPLSLRLASGKCIVRPHDTGAEIGSEPLPVSAIVLTQFAPNSVWQPVHISPGEATLEILRNTVSVRSNPARSLEYSARVTRSGIAIRSLRGEADVVAPQLLETVDEFTKASNK